MEQLKRGLKLTTRAIRGWAANNPLKLFPLPKNLNGYNALAARSDTQAALNIALLAVPQGMAYAAIAEVPILYGIICSAIAAIVAPLFASSRHTILGPTNATALMVFSFFAAGTYSMQDKLNLMPLLVVMVGIICVIGALFKAAELVQYVSQSVLVGYITGAAILIMINQGKHIFGVNDVVTPAKNFFGMFEQLATAYAHYQWQPTLLGLGTLILYLVLNKWLKALPNFAISLAIAAITSALLAKGNPAWAAAVPNFGTFALTDLTLRFPTPTSAGLFNDISALLGVAFAIAFLASLENTVMSKSLSSRTGQRTEINQDMLSVGLSNIACAFTAGMPASGSLTRSALNYESGAKTGVASIISGAISLIAIFLFASLTPNPVSFIPKAALAGLVVGVSTSLIKGRNIRICLRSTPEDAAVLIITFLTALIFPLYVAIFIGVFLSIFLFLRKVSRPELVEYEISDTGELRELDKKQKRPTPAISIVHVEGALFFGAAEIFQTQVQQMVRDPNIQALILRLKNAHHLDATSVMALRELIRFVRSQNRHIIISGATRGVYKVLKKSGVLSTLQRGCRREEGETNLFFYAPSNPNISTRDAIIRAQELLGTKKAEVKIFYDAAREQS